MPRYCSPKCRSASYRGRTPAPPPARTYDEDAARITRALLTKAQALEHRANQPVPAYPLETIQYCVALRRDLEEGLAVLIRQSLQNGATWRALGKTLNLTPNTLKSRYSAPQVDKLLRDRADRRPPAMPALPAQYTPADGPLSAVTRSLPGRPGDALARALSHLHKVSGHSVRALAPATGVSPSFIYRIMAGQRTPKWPVVLWFARACDTDPEDLCLLWNKAQGLASAPAGTYDDAVRQVQAALRGLYLAAARPPLATLPDRPGAAGLTERTARALLGQAELHPGDLAWPAVRAFVAAVRGDEDDIEPLWARVQALHPPPGPDGPCLPAQSFG
ncbi:helix-turn-helix domain-containing protein [Streptomyces chrestomyceticus]|uniref:helix-turn-helix domain-containing protein n=1 Tax=Streptomyces chrestomyceticus TaxID=68185 RepID=UPI0033E3CA30